MVFKFVKILNLLTKSLHKMRTIDTSVLKTYCHFRVCVVDKEVVSEEAYSRSYRVYVIELDLRFYHRENRFPTGTHGEVSSRPDTGTTSVISCTNDRRFLVSCWS